MATTEEELSVALQNILGGGQQSSPESLSYARAILSQQMMRLPGREEEAFAALEEQQESIRGALEQARKRIQEMEGPSRAEKLFALSAGLGATTKAGSIGETAAAVSRNLQPLAAEQRKFEATQAAGLSEIDLALAGVGGPLTEAEFEMAKLEFERETKMGQEALRTLRYAGTSSRGARTRQAKVDDLVRLHNFSEGEAMALVDGYVGIEIVEGLGVARLVNEINGSVREIPLNDLSQFEGYFPDDEKSRPPRPENGVSDGPVDYRSEEEKLADDIVMRRIDEGTSLWDMTDGTGPWAAARVGGSIISSIFGGSRVGIPLAVKTIEGRHGLMLRSRDLARALIDNPRMPVRLIEMAIEEAAIEHSILDTPELMKIRMVALDRELWDRYLDAIEGAQDVTLPQQERSDLKQNARLLNIFLRDLRVPLDRQKRRTRIIPGLPSVDVPEYAEGEAKFEMPPPGWAGSELQWKLMPMEHRKAWDDFYE
jgi:hypothetical protein